MSDDQSVPLAEVDGWIHAVDSMYYAGLWDAAQARAAEDAAAGLMSEYAIDNAPPEVLEMVRHAIEAGYMTALQDVREGSFDAEIRAWRPDLGSG